MMNRLLILLMLLVLSSCSKKIVPAVNVQVKDTVYTEITVEYRDTVIVYEAAKISHVFEADTLKESIQKTNDKAKLSISKQGKALHIDCDCEEELKALQLADKKESKVQVKEVIITETKEVRYIPGFLKWMLIIETSLLVGFVLGWLI